MEQAVKLARTQKFGAPRREPACYTAGECRVDPRCELVAACREVLKIFGESVLESRLESGSDGV